jgi:hypothetical protein
MLLHWPCSTAAQKLAELPVVPPKGIKPWLRTA